MPRYEYTARDDAGRKVSGLMEAGTEKEVAEKLRATGLMTTGVIERPRPRGIITVFDEFRGITQDEMLMFYFQLSNMISAGLTILISLITLSRQTRNRRLRDAIGSVVRQVESGSALSQAFASCPHVFPGLFTNMIKAAETSGTLDAALARYADFFEKHVDMKEKVKGALFYPAMLMAVGIGVIAFIVTFVTPRFAVIYARAGISLPLPTMLINGAGILLRRHWQSIVLLFISLVLSLRWYRGTEKGGFFLDKLTLRSPVVGPLSRKVAIARFTRTLAALLGSGVGVLESLDTAEGVIGNKVLERVIGDVRRHVEKGERMSEPLRISKDFPLDVARMVFIGEESGELVPMLNKIADFYDMAVTHAVKRLTTVIEPVFLMIMGGMVGCIMVSMLMPMFDMVKTLRH